LAWCFYYKEVYVKLYNWWILDCITGI